MRASPLPSPDDPPPAPGLNAAQRRHLVAAYALVCHLSKQIEEAGREGRSPSGVGAPLTPLPEHRLEATLAPLRELRAQLRAVVAEQAPAELAAHESLQPQAMTLTWLSNLLDQVRVAVDNLQPGRMAKYGHVGKVEAEALAKAHAQWAALLRESRASVEGQVGSGRSAQGPSCAESTAADGSQCPSSC